MACWRGHLSIAKLLRGRGAPVDARDEVRLRTGPGWGCARAHAHSLCAQDGKSARDLAAEWDHHDVVAWLDSLPRKAEVEVTEQG